MATQGDIGPDRAWGEAIRALDPADVRESLRAEMGRAFLRIGERFVAIAVKDIQAGKYAPNSEITQAFKQSSKPLVDDGDLMASITYDIDLADMAVWLGANRAAKRKGKDGRAVEMVNLVRILHDGGSINVAQHPKVRQAIFARLSAIAKGEETGDRAKARAILERMAAAATNRSGSGAARPSVWLIPARPFIAAPIASAEFEALADREVNSAVDRGIRRVLHANLGGL